MEMGSMKITPYFLLLRPKQWIKNLLVFAVPLASKDIFEASVFIDCLVAFVAFAMASSSIYAWNDIRDREEDKFHPVKSSRPVASGAVGVKSAVFLSLASLSLSLIVGGYFGNLDLVIAVIAYLVIQVLYQLRLRDVPLFDIAMISSGFVLRAIAGGLAAGIYISVWFLSVTASASLFIVGGLATESRVVVLVVANHHYVVVLFLAKNTTLCCLQTTNIFPNHNYLD
jgi:decaprenyl-phosphate phosphoribosyltransferase